MSSVLLVHGAWHGSWCWDDVLKKVDGARAVDLPSAGSNASFDADVATVRAALDDMTGPVVLCGHSYGGAVISQAGSHPNVGHLVFIAAFALLAGETTNDNAAKHDADVTAAPPNALEGNYFVDRAEGTLVLQREATRVGLYNDCSDDVANWAADQLRPQSISALNGTVTDDGWRGRPSTYVLCTQDETIRPPLQRFFARRCTNVVELDASHSPMLSLPDELAAIITTIRTAV